MIQFSRRCSKMTKIVRDERTWETTGGVFIDGTPDSAMIPYYQNGGIYPDDWGTVGNTSTGPPRCLRTLRRFHRRIQHI